MKITCDIIRDVLPLYAEDMVSKDTRAMVEEHLEGCEACTGELGKLKRTEVALDVETNALDKVREGIAKRRILAVMTAMFWMLSICVSGILFLNAPVYLTAEQAVEQVERLENGDVRVKYSSLVMGTGMSYADGVPGNWGFVCWGYMKDVLFSANRMHRDGDETRETSVMWETAKELGVEIDEAHWNTMGIDNFPPDKELNFEGIANVWYLNAADGTAAKLLSQGDYPTPEVALMEVSHYTGYYCMTLAALFVFILPVSVLLRNKRGGKALRTIAALIGSLLAATSMACGLQFAEPWGDFSEHILEGMLTAIPWFAAVLCTLRYCDLRKQDKGL